MSEFCKMRRVWKIEADQALRYKSATIGTKARWQDLVGGDIKDIEVYTIENIFDLADGGLLFLLALNESSS